MMDAVSLSNTNGSKIAELEDELASLLRDIVAGRDELEITTFTEDEMIKLTAVCSRLYALAGIRDLSGWMEEDEGGKQSSAWDIIGALAERGKLGYKEEEMV
jgi:cohesin complex subunit SA-1/2